ncbi:hypothetical protein Csa_011372 [Cucumis sativus]|nr:hypothetical protein Csa_011372 [Cucumis sativus]
MSRSAVCRAWFVAASIGAVEALKDQGVCRWNNVIKSLQQHGKTKVRSYYQAKKLSASSSSAIANQIKKSREDKMRKVMDLSCLGPSLWTLDYILMDIQIQIFLSSKMEMEKNSLFFFSFLSISLCWDQECFEHTDHPRFQFQNK